MSASDRSRGPSLVSGTTSASLLDHASNYRTWIADLCGPHLLAPVLVIGDGGGFVAQGSIADGDVPYGDVPYGDVADGATFGSAVMVNVLETVEDEQTLLREVLERLEPGGRVCIWAPTYEFLSSPFDAKLGRVRRYRKRQLETAVRLAGFEVVEGRHVNLPGWVGWLVLCRALRREPTPRMVRNVDTWIVPAVRWFESRVRVPVAMSVFLVARKPG